MLHLLAAKIGVGFYCGKLFPIPRFLFATGILLFEDIRGT